MLSATPDNLIQVLIDKTSTLVLAVICLLMLTLTAQADTISPRQSIDQALQRSPQLKALEQQQQAARYDLQQTRNRYLPSVDLQLGYGVDQHSDDATRRATADPADSDWDNRSNASVTLTQNLYTGGEIGQQVRIRKALLESSQLQQQSSTQTVILDALTAHLEIFRQRELVELAQSNLDIHQDIYQSLEERAQAGSGNLADVSQAKARLARAQSSLVINRSELAKALISYARTVGTSPDPQQVSNVELPDNLPVSLEQAQQLMETQNPDLIALKTTFDEADARVGLAKANYKPKLDLQLSSRYADNIEGDQSWQNTNEAILNLRWNLFNGGQDKAGKQAAMARKLQTHSVWEDRLFELRETTAATWETFRSLQEQKAAYRDAAEFSRKTFDAYLNQFSISQRSLLDILSAENDFFQSASQLINVTVNETILAYRLLALTGELQNLQFSGTVEPPQDLQWLQLKPQISPVAEMVTEQVPLSAIAPAVLSEEETLRQFIEHWLSMWSGQNVQGYFDCYGEQFIPGNGRDYSSWQASRRRALTSPLFIELSISDLQLLKQGDTNYLATFFQQYHNDRYRDRTHKKLLLGLQGEKWKIVREEALPGPADKALNIQIEKPEDTDALEDKAEYAIEIGPCITTKEIEQAKKLLSDFGVGYSQRTSTGQVKFVRLYEGTYSAEQAKIKLAEIQSTVDFAYLLADGNQQSGLYLGSFREKERAVTFSEKLRRMGIETSLREAQVELSGEFLSTNEISSLTARKLSEMMSKIGLNTSNVN